MTKQPASTGSRLIHSIVVLGLAAATLAASHLEVVQAYRVLGQRYSAGTPPNEIACAAAAAALACIVGLLVSSARGRAVPLWLTGLVVLAFAGALGVLFGADAPQQRSVPGANVKCLDRAKELSGRLNQQLQLTGLVPTGASELTVQGVTPFFKGLTPLPWRVEKVNRTDLLPDDAEPGWLLFRAGVDGRTFTIACVGISADGAPQLLREGGKPVEYRGAYSSDSAL